MKTNPLIVFHKEFDNSGILFDPETGSVFGLNATAVCIWECLEQSLTLPEILAVLKERFHDMQGQASDDLGNFLAELAAQGFVSCGTGRG